MRNVNTNLFPSQRGCAVKTARVLKWKFIGTGTCIGIVSILLLRCANPSQNIRWQSSVDLPVTSNKKFNLASIMDSVFFDQKTFKISKTLDTIPDPKNPGKTIEVTHYDTTMELINAYPLYDSVTKKPIPDTVGFGFPTHDSVSTTISEDTLEDKRYSNAIGPIPLTDAPPDTISIPLIGAYAAGTVKTVSGVPLSVKYVYSIQFSSATAQNPQNLRLTVTNNSTVAFTAVSVTLGALGTQTIANLGANSSGIATFSVGGKRVDSVIAASVSVTPQASGVFIPGNSLVASFSMTGLLADKVVVLDNLLANFQRTFTNEYKLTDTVDVSYIDINKGFFNYSVTNHSGVDMILSVVHRHLWTIDFCQKHVPTMNSVADLGGLSSKDSMDGSNCKVVDDATFLAGRTNEYRKQNISSNRLFGEWNPATKKSVTKVDYKVSLGVFGRRVTLSAGDTLVFIIRTTSFKFDELYGAVKEPYQRKGEPDTIAVDLPWKSSVNDSLRNKFILQKVFAKITTRVDIPPGAFIDTLNIHYVISSITNAAVACSSDAVLLHVTRDSTYRRTVDITSVVNDYPEWVRVDVSMKVPLNTTIKAVDDLVFYPDSVNSVDYDKYIGRMIIKGLVDYDMVAPLSWYIADTVTMDLGGDTLDLDKVKFTTDIFKRMTNRSASFTVDAVNYTNVALKLYALVATDSAKVGPLVDTGNANYINTNRFTQLIRNPEPGFVSLLKTGLYVPPRDSLARARSTIALSESDMNQILNAKKSGWRWELRFMPKYVNGVKSTAYDALSNTDWIKLNSWIHVDGVNCVDSLFQE